MSVALDTADALRAAAKAAFDAGDIGRARAVLELLDTPPAPPRLTVVRGGK